MFPFARDAIGQTQMKELETGEVPQLTYCTNHLDRKPATVVSMEEICDLERGERN
jgi:hypothetical protein